MSNKEIFKGSDIYSKVVAKGIPHSNHESDLYIPVNDETRELIKNYAFPTNVTTFVNRVEGGLWYDIPFAYIPFWEKAQRKA
jgi:hypothetical protein